MREKIIEKSTPSTPLDSTPKVEYRNYLEMAKYGHYPLFFEEWLAETLPVETSMPTRKATHNVRHVFNLLARHNTVERKRTALISMDKVSRQEFIRAFFRVVEEDILKETKTLQ